jgi:mRNA interferase MazF
VRFGCSILGMAANVRPVLVVSVEYGDLDRALTTVVPHTTSLRGSRFEVAVRVPFLQPGAFLAQGIVTQPSAHAIRKLGTRKPDQFAEVLLVVERWLGLREGGKAD